MVQTTKFHFSIDTVDIPSRKLLPVEIIRANSFEELLKSTCDFVSENNPDFLDSCVITSWKKDGVFKTISFPQFTTKIVEHIINNTDLGGEAIEAFEI